MGSPAAAAPPIASAMVRGDDVAAKGGRVMTRVLLVYHDVNVADVEGDELRRAGYEVDRCAGPIDRHSCPVLDGRPCWQVEKADVLVYDTWDADFSHTELIEDLLDLHPDKPLVLTSSVSPDEFAADRRDEVKRIEVAPSRAALQGAIERVLRAPRKPRSGASAHRREPVAFVGPHW